MKSQLSDTLFSRSFMCRTARLLKVGVLSILAAPAVLHAATSANLPISAERETGPAIQPQAKGEYIAETGTLIIRGLALPELGNTPCSITADMGDDSLEVTNVQSREKAEAKWIIVIDVSDKRRNRAIASMVRTVGEFIGSHVRETDHVQVCALACDLEPWGDDDSTDRAELLHDLEERAKYKQFGDRDFRRMTYISAALLPKIRAAAPGSNILLLSDGLDESADAPEHAKQLKAEARTKGIAIHCMAYPDVDNQYKGAANLQAFALSTGGTYLRADEKNNLAIAPENLSLVAACGHPQTYDLTIAGIHAADDDLDINFSKDGTRAAVFAIPRNTLAKAIAECQPSQAEEQAKEEAAVAMAKARETEQAKAEAEEKARQEADARSAAEAETRKMAKSAQAAEENRQREKKIYVVCLGSGILAAIVLLIVIISAFRKKNSGKNPAPAPAKVEITSYRDGKTFDATTLSTVDLLPSSCLNIKIGGKEFTYPITKKTLAIGSSPSCDIVLNDATISRNHCVLKLAQDGTWRITDMGSVNKIYAAGALHDSLVLKNGDQFELGNVIVQFIQH